MSVPPSHESWVERIPNWFKFAAAAVTGLIGFIVLVQDNFELGIVAIGIVTIVMCLYGFILVLNERVKDANGKPTSAFRYARYHRLVYSGIGATLLAVVVPLAIPASRAFIIRALSGPPPIPAPPATLIPTSLETSTPAPTPTITPTITPAPTVTPTPLAFAPASDGETLILIARFHNTTVVNTEPEVKIRRKIEEELVQLGENNVRVEIEPTILRADARVEAQRLGEKYRATIVVWGEDTGVETIVNYLDLRQSTSDFTNARIVERLATQLADPPKYTHFITVDLPNQLAFLALFAIAKSYYVDFQYDQAISVLDRAVILYGAEVGADGQSAAYFRLGWLYERVNEDDPEQAIVHYTKSINVGGQSALDAYFNRALLYIVLEEWEQAIDDLNHAISLNDLSDNDNTVIYYRARGIVYAMMKEWERAVADMQKGIELTPEDALGYFWLGRVYSWQGNWGQATSSYLTAIELSPDNADINHGLCWAYANMSEPKIALPYCNRAIELESHYTFYRARAIVQAVMQDFPAAINDLQIYIDGLKQERNPDEFAINYFESMMIDLREKTNPFLPLVIEIISEFDL